MGDESRFAMSRAKYGLENEVMFSVLLSLAFVVLLVFVLFFYIRHFLRQHEGGPQPNASLSLPLSTSEKSNSGIDPDLLHKIPAFECQSAHGDCAVCLAPLEKEIIRLLPTCRHVFHVECIDTWLHSHSRCPVCRGKVEVSYSGFSSSTPSIIKDRESSSPPLNLSLSFSQRSGRPDIHPETARP